MDLLLVASVLRKWLKKQIVLIVQYVQLVVKELQLLLSTKLNQVLRLLSLKKNQHLKKIINMALKTVVLEPGDCIVLPSDANIVAVTANGAITASSTCDNLPDPTNYKCWRFMWADVSDDADYNDAYFTGIKIGDTTYNVNGAPVAENNSYDNGA